MEKKALPVNVNNVATVPAKVLLDDIRSLIQETRGQAATAVNAALTMLYWRIGKRIREDILGNERAGYGDEVVSTLSRQLGMEYGRGFSEKSLRHMIRFNDAFPDEQIVSALMRQLSWSHFLPIIYISDPLQRDFYAEMCRLERWSTRTLQKKISSMLYERTALSRKPEKLVQDELETLRKNDLMTPDIAFRDPYLLDFLGLKDTYQEKDLETAIVREMESFLLELGAGFSFIARQKRITVDGDDFYLDLLFFHRGLRRLIAIELKLGKFQPDHFGQMALYLRWLDKYERKAGEEAPLGIILCSGKDEERIELLELGQAGIHVAEYLTELPPKEILQQKLHAAIKLSRKRLKNREG